MRKKALSLLKLVRPINSAMVGFAVLIGAWITEFSLDGRLMLGFLTGFFLAGASMALNDYFDREVDAIDKPYRPIPSGAVKPSEAIALASAFAGAGLIAALVAALECFFIAVAFFCLATTYNAFGKRLSLFGNLMVASCVAIPFIYGGLLARGPLQGLPLAFAALAFLSAMGREVTKGIADVHGDRKKGFKTLATTAGLRSAARVAVIFYGAAVGLGMLLLSGLVGPLCAPFIGMACAGFCYSSVRLLRNPSPKRAERVKNEVLAWMLLGLIGFGVGAI